MINPNSKSYDNYQSTEERNFPEKELEKSDPIPVSNSHSPSKVYKCMNIGKRFQPGRRCMVFTILSVAAFLAVLSLDVFGIYAFHHKSQESKDIANQEVESNEVESNGDFGTQALESSNADKISSSMSTIQSYLRSLESGEYPMNDGQLEAMLNGIEANLKVMKQNPSFLSAKQHQREMISEEQNPLFLSAKQHQREMISKEQNPSFLSEKYNPSFLSAKQPQRAMISKEQNARLMLNRIRSSLSNTEVNEELRLASLLDKLDARLKRLSLFDKLENPSF